MAATTAQMRWCNGVRATALSLGCERAAARETVATNGAADAAAGGATDVALTDEERVVARDALLAAADATARTGWWAATDAAYMGFTLDSLTHSIFLESKESVCSNGVLLERQ